MTLDRLNHWLTLLANVGVVAGLVLVAAQLHQNTEAIRVQAASSLSSRLSEADAIFVGDTIHLVMEKAIYHPNELTPAEMAQMWSYVDMYFAAAQDTWQAYQAGNADEAAWALA